MGPCTSATTTTTQPVQRPNITPVAPASHGRRTVVLDTSVLMADSRAHLAYPNADVVIPLVVIDQLDRNKSRPDFAGRNAREFLRHLETARLSNGGDIATPVELPGGARLRVERHGPHLPELTAHDLDPASPDHRILAVALTAARGGGAVQVVSNDMALRLKAALLSLPAAEHAPGRTGRHAPHRRGYHTLDLSGQALRAIRSAQPVTITDLPPADQALLADVLDNEFVTPTGRQPSVRRRGDTLVRVSSHHRAWGLKAHNREQQFALDLLLDPTVRAVALRGRAGTGKTLLAIAAGMEAVLERKTHDRLLILRPMVAVGHEQLGFLPGDLAEKTTPWFAAVVDSLVALRMCSYLEASHLLTGWIDAGIIELAPLTFLRGRSVQRSFVILDGAQDVEQGTVKTVVSRLGEGSTLVLTGDDEQIDQPFVSALTCGLNAAVDAFAGLDLFGQVYFSTGERSRLADLAADRM